MRNPKECYQAARVLRGLRSSGLELFPLAVNAKTPRDRGFLLHDYGNPDFESWFEKGGGWGIRARTTDLIMDIDPKNGGLDSFEMLKWETNDDFDSYPWTETGRGNGGRHIFMTKPADGRWRWHLPGYAGIDFQSLGRYVVAPGTLHPDTGRPYVLHAPATGFRMKPAPAGLLTMLKKPPRTTTAGESGAISNNDLWRLLNQLDAHEFGQGGAYHDEWLDIAMGSHYGTNGEGWQVWLDWCATDERYAEDGEKNLARWDSFDSDRGDGVTWKTLMRAVARSGDKGRSIVGKLRVRGESKRGNNATSAKDDFSAFITPKEVIPDEDYATGDFMR